MSSGGSMSPLPNKRNQTRLTAALAKNGLSDRVSQSASCWRRERCASFARGPPGNFAGRVSSVPGICTSPDNTSRKPGTWEDSLRGCNWGKKRRNSRNPFVSNGRRDGRDIRRTGSECLARPGLRYRRVFLFEFPRGEVECRSGVGGVPFGQNQLPRDLIVSHVDGKPFPEPTLESRRVPSGLTVLFERQQEHSPPIGESCGVARVLNELIDEQRTAIHVGTGEEVPCFAQPRNTADQIDINASQVYFVGAAGTRFSPAEDHFWPARH